MARDELRVEIQRARQAGVQALLTGPRAQCAEYDDSTGELVVHLLNDTVVRVPVGALQGLADAPADKVRQVEIVQQGLALHWDELDVHFTVPGIVQGVYGTRAWMSAIGRKGGAAKSDSKQRSSRENGSKGGRPRSRDAGQQPTGQGRTNVVSGDDVVGAIAADTGLDADEVRSVIDELIGHIQQSSDSVGSSVRITGFGTFRVRPGTREASTPAHQRSDEMTSLETDSTALERTRTRSKDP